MAFSSERKTKCANRAEVAPLGRLETAAGAIRRENALHAERRVQTASGVGKCQPLEACPLGEELRNYNEQKKGECKACGLGFSKDTIGKYGTRCTACEPCPEGFKRVDCGGPSKGECQPCEVGTFKSVIGEWSTQCSTAKACTDGQWQSRESTTIDDTECSQITDCGPLFAPFGGYAEFSFTATSDNVCKQVTTCAKYGQYELKASTATSDRVCEECKSCPAGFMRNGCSGKNQGECQACKPGFFKSGEGDWYKECDECQSCPPEKCARIAVAPVKACVPCDEGLFESNGKCVACGNCPAGEGRVGCSGHSEGTCVKCAANTFSETNSADSCAKCEELVCGAGKERKNCGQESKGSCVTCSEGYFKPDGLLECTACGKCPEGHERAGCAGDSKGQCVACDEGTYESNGVCVSCEACPTGQERIGCGSADEGSCVACNVGTYELQGKCVACENCPSGKERIGCEGGDGGTCIACESGTFSQTQEVENVFRARRAQQARFDSVAEGTEEAVACSATAICMKRIKFALG